MKKLMCGGLLLAASFVARADCNSVLTTNNAASQFHVILPSAGVATVRDNKTGLEWMRCSLGQQWSEASSQCLNDAAQNFNFTWTQALAAAKASRYAGFSDWRLPNKKELGSILELSCLQPAINISVFPDTPSGKFWSATPIVYSDAFFAWYVDFTDGGYGNLSGEKLLWVRLVRDAP